MRTKDHLRKHEDFDKNWEKIDHRVSDKFNVRYQERRVRTVYGSNNNFNLTLPQQRIEPHEPKSLHFKIYVTIQLF